MRVVIAAVVLAGCGRIGFDTPQADAPAPSDAPRSDALASVCGPAYSSFAGVTSLYRVMLTGQLWLDAEADCESDGGHLIVIDDSNENNWLVNQLVLAAAPSAWIGSSDHVMEGTFRWVTGAPMSFANWDVGEPNNSLSSEDCVQIYVSGVWNDSRCYANQFVYVCECDQMPRATPATYCDTQTSPNCGECGVVCVNSCDLQSCT
ncbi:MAG: hypothetical protein JWO36_5138 [Myxococcales bacterium]|nr:hypothetical protein [Myxococcales bacterium]